MKCRQMINGNIVWFGSSGVDENGNAIKNDNFVSDIDALAQTLTQKLQVMRSELWHNMSFGLPLLENKKSKMLLDTAVADIVLSNENVLTIQSLDSRINGEVYECDILVKSIFGDISISI